MNLIKKPWSHRVAFAALFFSMIGCGAVGNVDGDDGAFDTYDIDIDDIDTTEHDLSLRSGNLWTPLWNGLTQVKVCFTNGTSSQRSRVRTVAEGSWEAIAAGNTGPFGRYGVDFIGWSTCPTNTSGMVPITFNNYITNETIGLGRAITRMDLSTLAPDSTIIHEFGHALGYTHEFLRTDYDDVDPDCTATKGTPPDFAVTNVDVASIMNYEQCGAGDQITFQDAVAHVGFYGPFIISYGQKVALRHDPSWNYVRGDSTPDTQTSGILEDREFTLVNANNSGDTGQLKFGDSVRIKTHNGQFLRSNGRGNLVSRTSSASSATVWQVFGRIGQGTPVRVNDEVLFRASDFAYLKTNSSKRLTTDVGDFFRLQHLWKAINLVP